MAGLTARAATPDDAAAITTIYNQGIAERIATFETEPRQPADILPWFDGVHPVVVVTAAASPAATGLLRRDRRVLGLRRP